MKKKIVIFLAIFSVFTIAQSTNYKTGSVIFIHPDGTALADWNALRMITVGPDSEINWDKLNDLALYQGHIKDRVTSSSNAGATIHAYGIKAELEAFGMNSGNIPTAKSGKKLTIMQEAKDKGIHTGLINSGSIIEPGTAVFVSSEVKRNRYESITKQVINSGTDLILSGGEKWLLPQGVKGRFVESGEREDGLNLIDQAIKAGYQIVYTKEELANLSPKVKKVLGVFAKEHTFNDETEEKQIEETLKNYIETAPTLQEMTEFALKFFSEKGKFFLVIEEEGTDNFGNKNNAQGKLDALKRADDAIGVVVDYIKRNPNTLLVTAADSEAGGMEVTGYEIDNLDANTPLPPRDPNGAPIDGAKGTATLPFLSAPDANGNRFPFGIAWSSFGDVTGSVIARAHGLNSKFMKGKVDNTFIYRLMYLTLFGKWVN